MKRTTEAKRMTLKRILEFIRTTRGASAKQIAEKEKLKLRQAYNYLYDLEELGLIVYNETLRMWQPIEAREKMVFKTKTDYELALQHSKKLLFSNKEKQRFDLVAPHNWARMLAFPDSETQYLVHHLKSGYEELWLLIEKYKRIKDKGTEAELNKIEEEVSVRLNAIMFQVEHGIPLKGECAICPTKYVTIQE